MFFKGSTDQPASQDSFGISNYISGLCSFIIECDTPMTIAIQGDWGSGKTSVMEMIRSQIDKRTVHCVWFNTWQFSQFNTVDSLPLSLIGAIISALGTDGSEAAGKMREGLRWLGAVAANLTKRIAYAGIEMVAGGENTADIKKYFEREEKIAETISDLKNRFQDCVNDSIRKNGVDRILVFIDDLDRLQPLRAVELLEVLKIFLDCEKCVFVLAIDYNVVVSGVKSKYGTDFDENKGRSFFDKIIQVPFKMPVAQYDISSFVKKTYEAVTATQANEKDILNYVALINNSIGSNPRSMKRLFNSYFLLLKVVDKNVLDRDSVSKKALFAILCMQQHFESLYNHIVSSREEISAEFFNELATSDRVEVLLKNEDIKVKAGEPERIQEFMRLFNKTLSASGEDDHISVENVDRLRLVLKSSSVTATTESNPVGDRKRLSYTYKGDTYKSRGANKMNLGNFALRLISDYASATNKTAQELQHFINGQIPPYATLMRKLNLGLLVQKGEPLLERKDVQPYFFMDKADAIQLSGETIYVQNSWGGGELNTLIEILGFNAKVIRE